MELRQESLFADETKGGIEVIYSKFIDQRRMDYKALFGGFDHLRVITFSYGLGFVETVADMFEDVEIIIGSMNTVRPDIVDVAMHQKLEMKRLSKRKQLVERVKDGSVRIYFNMRKMSHEKLYILSADDGRCRIITGSANLSKRAFTGGQYEEITCFDGDVVMFDNRLARFESLKGMSSTTPLEPAAMVDFASVAGDSEGELEVVPVMRAKGVVYLCDMPEDDDEVETFYTFNPKDMTEEEREQYAAMREHKVDYKPVTGGRVIIPDEVRRVIRAAREACRRACSRRSWRLRGLCPRLRGASTASPTICSRALPPSAMRLTRSSTSSGKTRCSLGTTSPPSTSRSCRPQPPNPVASSSTPMSSTRWRWRGSCGPTCPAAPWTACATSSESSARTRTEHWRIAMTSLRS